MYSLPSGHWLDLLFRSVIFGYCYFLKLWILCCVQALERKSVIQEVAVKSCGVLSDNQTHKTNGKYNCYRCCSVIGCQFWQSCREKYKWNERRWNPTLATAQWASIIFKVLLSKITMVISAQHSLRLPAYLNHLSESLKSNHQPLAQITRWTFFKMYPPCCCPQNDAW